MSRNFNIPSHDANKRERCPKEIRNSTLNPLSFLVCTNYYVGVVINAFSIAGNKLTRQHRHKAKSHKGKGKGKGKRTFV